MILDWPGHGGWIRASGRIAFVIVLGALLLGAGCIGPGSDGQDEVRETVNQTVSAAGVSALDLQATNGACEVHGWTEPRIAVQATKRSRHGESELQKVSLEVKEGSTLTVRATRTSPFARASVDMVVMVPESIGHIRVRTSNGDVLVDKVSATVVAESSNGAIRVFDAGGGLDLWSSNGGITVRGAGGIVNARTSNGAIEVGEAAALGDLETSNGRISAEVRAVFDEVALRTSNGNIELALDPGLDAVIDAETSSGRIDLANGAFRVDEVSRNRVHGTAGSGGHTVTARTSNGDIRFVTAG
ncbi:MAG: DUF4097 domain-containing protein [Methanospirillum sp.]|nr:DUF4097 domain-containing protein [Methanospirillum sp.]